MVRRMLPCLILGLLSACSGVAKHARPQAFATAEDAVQQLCASPASHRDIVKAVRTLNWTVPTQGEIPEQALGNGSVRWSQVAVSPRRDMVVAAGRIGGTSFCRVYARQAQPAATLPHLEQTMVLGAPLGAPDFREHVAGDDVTGWHRHVGREWRAVHLFVPEAGAARPRMTPLVIEVTRAA